MCKLFKPLDVPKPGDWLFGSKEAHQSFQNYRLPFYNSVTPERISFTFNNLTYSTKISSNNYSNSADYSIVLCKLNAYLQFNSKNNWEESEREKGITETNTELKTFLIICKKDCQMMHIVSWESLYKTFILQIAGFCLWMGQIQGQSWNILICKI